MYERSPSIAHKFQGYVFNQMTLGDLANALAELDAEMPVQFDNGENPGTFGSYRGYYEQAYLGEGGGSAVVGELREVLDRFIDSTQTGYKGGEFHMTESTPLWRAEYGRTGYHIVGTVQRDGNLILLVDLNGDD